MHKNISARVMMVAGAVLSLCASVQAADMTASNQTSRVIVKYRTDVAVQTAEARTRARIQSVVEAPRQAVHVKTMSNGARVYDLGGSVSMERARQAAMAIQAADPNIEYAAPDVWVRPQQVATPNDTSYSSQWSLQSRAAKPGAANFSGIWTRATGSGVTVAIVDTGYTPHPDMAGQEILGYDFVSDVATAGEGDGRDADPSDPGDYCAADSTNSSWHGLKVASQIAAVANNGSGIAGGAPGAQVLQVRALGRCGGWLSDVADGIAWAAGASVPGAPVNSTPAKVINVSLGGAAGTVCYSYMQDAVDTALSHNASVVVAAGNEASTSVGAPANCSGVITVGAHTASADLASYSNRSSYVTLTAPGGGGCAQQTSTCDNTPTVALGNTGVTSPAGPLTPAYFSGTSSAAPHVSAAIALMLQANSSLTPAQIRSVLVSTAVAHPSGTYCADHAGSCGAGMLDVTAAIGAVSSPVITFTAPTSAVAGSTNVTVTANAVGVGPFTYSWSQVGGPAVALQGTNTAAVTFTAPASRAEVQLQVSVTGSNGLSTTDTVYVRVNNAPALAPIASVATNAGQPLQLSLTAFDVDGDAVIAALVSGPSGAYVSGTTLIWPNPQPGVHTFVLQAEDQSGLRSASRSVTVTIQGASGSSSTSQASSSGGGGGGGSLGLADVAAMLSLAVLAAARKRQAPVSR